eukprot:CAMPEP_0195096280 /NCGR_PEP_ID=MMETSP0448-20130528/51389_1 /TAXON_ID=66468 /ORGANISM="Heterocapsa triquestra, Strain CCMP 448" /LENGTH=34 /DNA_ID= /DNA_START= /DNA_END= /DNA_ORIENTATION=
MSGCTPDAARGVVQKLYVSDSDLRANKAERQKLS